MDELQALYWGLGIQVDYWLDAAKKTKSPAGKALARYRFKEISQARRHVANTIGALPQDFTKARK